MRSSDVDVRTPDGVADAYLTRPDDGGLPPPVLFVMDGIGLRPRIEETADGIAERAGGGGPRWGRGPGLRGEDGSWAGAITGYCMGVRFGWRIATAYRERATALAGFHGGGLVTDAPDSPHLSAGQLKAELYLGHADQDPNMTPEQIATLERTLDEAGVRHRTEVYEGARHRYTMSDTAVYDEEAAERHVAALFELPEATVAVR